MKGKILPTALVLSALFFLFVGFKFGQGRIDKTLQTVTPDILFLTSPINSFSGKVEKIQGDTIFVSQQFTLSQPMPPPEMAGGTPRPIPTPETRKITYQVKIGPNTQISRPELFVPYLVKQVSPAPPKKYTVKDIRVNEQISVNTNADLRTLTKKEFEATYISLPQLPNSLSGQISKISGNTLFVKAVPPPSGLMTESTQPPSEKEYTILVTDNTEISRYTPMEPPKEGEAPKSPTPELLKVSDLTVGQQITVFTDVDVSSVFKFTALRIEPAIIIPPPVAISPVEAQTSPTLPPKETLSPTKAAALTPTE